MRTEDEVDGGGSPLELARGAIATLVYVLIRGGWLPLRVHVEQVHEEVVGQRLGPAGEDAVLGLSEVGVSGRACRQSGPSSRERSASACCPLHQQLLRRFSVSGSEVVAEPVRYQGSHHSRWPFF